MIKEPYRDYATEMIRLYNRVRTMTPQERGAWCEAYNGKPEAEDYAAVLRAANNRLDAEACLAMMTVYKPGAQRVHAFVTRYATDNYCDERTVYRLLRAARLACAKERGLTT